MLEHLDIGRTALALFRQSIGIELDADLDAGFLADLFDEARKPDFIERKFGKQDEP